MGFLRDMFKKNPLVSAILMGGAGSMLGSTAGGFLGKQFGFSPSWGQKIGGALGGAGGAAMTQPRESRTASALLGGFGGYHGGPALQSFAKTGLQKMGIMQPTPTYQTSGSFRNQPALPTTPGASLSPQATPSPFKTQAPVATAAGQYRTIPAFNQIPGQTTPPTPTPQRSVQGGTGGWLQRSIQGMVKPATKIGLTAAASSLLAPKAPEFPSQEEFYAGPQRVYQDVPGLKFDEQGNMIGVDANSLPTHVKLAVDEVDQILDQRLEALRGEAARAGMLNSSAYMREVQLLEAEGVEAKQEIISRYVYDATSMAHQREAAAMGMPSYAMERYGQEYQDYAQRTQAINQAVAGMFEQMEAEEQRRAAAEEAQREREAQRQQLLSLMGLLRG